MIRSTQSWFATIFVLVAFLVAAPLLAQGVQTATLRGTVTLPDGSPVPGVTVTASSPAQLGDKVTYTTETGQWILKGLAPGEYTVTFELEGMTTAQSAATASLGQITPVAVTMRPEAVEETIVVTGEQSSVLSDSQVSTTYTAEQVNQLSVSREIDEIASIAPGVTGDERTPNARQVEISGGFAYDNVFLIDGVDANDNLFGSPTEVYIEEAVADVQVVTSGISAEYGRFTGGVINVITKSGGNDFSGSIRSDLENDDWRKETPLEEQRGTVLQDDVSHFESATLGGYVLQDQLWFFAAGRDESSSESEALTFTGTPFPTEAEQTRLEGKLTWNLGARHQLQGQYTDKDESVVDPTFPFTATPSGARQPDFPAEVMVARYNGALSDSLFGELQYSEKEFAFVDAGGTSTAIQDSPFIGGLVTTPLIHYNAPYFDATDPEERNNEQAYGALSWFVDTATVGSHDIKLGYEDFTSTRTGGNSQSSTGFVFDADPLLEADGNPVLTADNELIPTFVPGVNLIERWIPTRGAQIDIQTQSVFLNDRWRLNDHWSFNLGVRYEEVNGEATGNITTVDTDRIVPRLGASYDLRGDGRYRFDATFAEYSGKYSETQFASNTTVGNPKGILGIYVGPPGQGIDFAPGLDPDNYIPFFASDGTANVRVLDDIQSPAVTEWTLSAGTELRRGGYLKAVYINREYDDFVEDFICTASAGIPCTGPVGDTGFTEVVVEGLSAGTFANQVFGNSDQPVREYEAIQLIGRHVLTDRWDLNGSWTYQIALDGNFEGEASNQPGIPSTFGDFPGYFDLDRQFPTGRLNDFQRHKLRLWSTYQFDLGRAGTLATTLLGNYDSGTAYSLFAGIPAQFTEEQARIASFYMSSEPTSTQNVFFGERGSETFDDATTFDLTLFYQLPIVQTWGLDAFVKADVINIFNDDTLVNHNTTVLADVDGPTDSFGLPTSFTRSDSFGNPIDNASFPVPREFRFAVGFRF